MINGSFFKFLAGFLGILLLSFVMLVGLSYYEKIIAAESAENVGKVSR